MSDDDDPDDAYSDEEYDEWPPIFNHKMCTCGHTPNQHGWVGCEVKGCECQAFWEE